MQLRNLPAVFRDQRAHRRQRIGGRPGNGGEPQIALVGLHRRDFRERRNLAGGGGEVGGLFEPQAHGVMVSRARLEGARRLVRNDAAVRDDDGAGTHFVHLFQDVGGDDDQLVLAEFVDEPPYFVLLVRIETIGGFVQDQHLRIVDDGLGQAHPPPEALRQRLDHLVDDGQEPQAFDHDVAPLPPLGAGEAADVGDEIQEFTDRHFTVTGRALGQIAHAGFGGHRFALYVVTAHRDFAGGGRDESGDHAHGGRLPGAVGAEKSKYLARLHGEGQVVHGELVAIAFGEIFYRNHGRLGTKITREVPQKSRGSSIFFGPSRRISRVRPFDR